ncbi:MAG TPA: response regulator [Symbiobacteriaceae bacterium]|jgi:two-component system KDP operon response regulator KdpE
MKTERDSSLPPGARILVVDDERQIRRFLRASLATQGYEVLEAGSVAEAMAQAAAAPPPDMVILDLGLPDGDGLDVVHRVREWSAMPILILSVRGQEADKVSALDAGADDYLTKPFSTGELLARLRVAMRRSTRSENEPVFVTGGLVLDLARRLVTVEGDEVHLTATEYNLLKTMALHSGKVLTHTQLLKMVWGPGYETEAHILRVNISNLRRKIEPDPLQPKYIVTEPGVGYRLRVSDPTDGVDG